jgi:hypothetical protein
MKVTVNVDLYKPRGKWGYGFQVTFEAPIGWVDDTTLLDLIADNQSEVNRGAVTDGGYTVVIKETEECMNNPDYKGFLGRLIPSTEFPKP